MRARRLALALAVAVWVAAGVAVSGAESPEPAMAALDARIAARPDDVEARAERARMYAAHGQPMAAYLDRLEIVRLRPEDGDVARLAAFDLVDAGAPQAAADFVKEHPAALAGEAGAALSHQIAGDLAARRIRWGWAEPVFDPAQRRHEAEAAIASLEAMHKKDPADARAAGDLLLAYRLADRMKDAVALWETGIPHDGAPYWLRNAAADAYLALHRPAEAEALYRSFSQERAGAPEPWLGIYWATIEQRHYGDAGAALDRLAKVPGQELTAEVQRGWLLLFSDRTAEGQELFERLFREHPGDRRVREGLATAYLWQGWPRRGLESVEEVL
ncbi:MAG TPA: hypothetical protein VFR03_20880, partial [Thermoanaerobaculia bacterium]|nr:hypothetical protein [Thermoanaerobaculia bacterium]